MPSRGFNVAESQKINDTKNQAQKAILFGSVLGGQKGVISLSSA